MKTFLLLVILLTSSSAFAEEELRGTMQSFMASAHTDKAVMSDIYLAGTSFGWANGNLATRGEQLLYCQPAHLVITTDQYVAIIDSYFAEHPTMLRESADDWQAYLLAALEQTFPCPKP